MTLKPMGDAAWRLEITEELDRPTLLQLLRAWPNVTDAVVTDHHALIRFHPSAPPDDPRPLLAQARQASPLEPRLHTIRVVYDGADLEEVSRFCGLSSEEVVKRHTERDYTVELVGFLPGFGYLGPLDEVLGSVPRRPTPRPRVPACSVAIASGRTAIYPFASPGGWHLLGTALEFVPFTPEHGARLQLGDRVKFVPA